MDFPDAGEDPTGWWALCVAEDWDDTIRCVITPIVAFGHNDLPMIADEDDDLDLRCRQLLAHRIVHEDACDIAAAEIELLSQGRQNLRRWRRTLDFLENPDLIEQMKKRNLRIKTPIKETTDDTPIQEPLPGFPSREAQTGNRWQTDGHGSGRPSSGFGEFSKRTAAS